MNVLAVGVHKKVECAAATLQFSLSMSVSIYLLLLLQYNNNNNNITFRNLFALLQYSPLTSLLL